MNLCSLVFLKSFVSRVETYLKLCTGCRPKHKMSAQRERVELAWDMTNGRLSWAHSLLQVKEEKGNKIVGRLVVAAPFSVKGLKA